MRRLLLLCSLLAAVTATQAAPADAWMPKPTWVKQGKGRFDMVAITWQGKKEPDIRLRARSHDGSWTRWTQVPTDDGAPHRSAPIWAGGSDRVQLKTPRGVHHVRLKLLNT